MTTTQLDLGIELFEKRLLSDRLTSGLILWTAMFRRMANRLRLRDRVIYDQLMLLEMEVPKESIQVLERIGKIKGMLAVCFLGLTIASIAALDSDPYRRSRMAGSSRITSRTEA